MTRESGKILEEAQREHTNLVDAFEARRKMEARLIEVEAAVEKSSFFSAQRTALLTEGRELHAKLTELEATEGSTYQLEMQLRRAWATAKRIELREKFPAIEKEASGLKTGTVSGYGELKNIFDQERRALERARPLIDEDVQIARILGTKNGATPRSLGFLGPPEPTFQEWLRVRFLQICQDESGVTIKSGVFPSSEWVREAERRLWG